MDWYCIKCKRTSSNPDYCVHCGNKFGASNPPIKKHQIKETKCICKSCGNVWYYGKQEILESAGAALHNCGNSMMCCSGCAPALLIPDKKVIDLDKCPKCNSRNITKEEVCYYV